MSSLAVKRIMNDIKILKSCKLEDENIYVSTNDEDIYNLKALIIGPPIKDAPYRGGFYFFDIVYPKNYPLSPPKVVFCTLNNLVRFNPNLYVNGKVCLSVLNTWSGPGWTSSHSIKDVLIILQSLLHEHPIQNEPGWEKETGLKSLNLNIVLAYYNIKVSVMQMIEKTPPTFEIFKDIMISYFVKNIDSYNKFILEYEKYEGERIKSGLYSMVIDYDLKKVQEDMLILYSKYENIYKGE
jgi:ubiquitin-protein ligase